ncbi:MAG: hypothetical protein WBC22_12325 [Sedimentisphaerales bacterium]
MKKLMLLVVLAGMVLVQGCSAGSALAVRSLSADRLSAAGEQQVIERAKAEFVVWHTEQHAKD